jgi:hypothetical protein
MPAFATQIAHYLERYHMGDADGAFHGLLELDQASLPELMHEFREATDTRLRVFLLGVIWQHRQQSVIPVLGEALLDSEPPVWREALDGLVALASPASLEALYAARTRHFTRQQDEEEFHRWLEEAIEQTEVEILKDHHET